MAAPSFAQKKNEEKEWKKKQKDMDPLAFKAMYEEYQQLKSDAASKERELSTLRKQLTTKEADISAKDVEINELRSQIQKAEADKGANDAQASQNLIANGDDYTKGIVFKVQVGAFTKKTYSEKIDGSFWEEDEDGVKKYTIGRFRDYQEATRFKNYLRAIGVSDAWIVAYEDNQRKDIKNILDNAGIPSTDDK
jgi:hypothetical protein